MKVKAIINKLINKIRYKKVIQNINSDNNKVFVDLGSTSIKMIYKGQLIKFKSSVRQVTDMNEVSVAQKNVITVNNNTFIIGEALKSNGVTDYKYQKSNIPELIFYGLKLIQSKGIEVNNNLEVNMLLPYNELKYKHLISKKVNGLYNVEGKQMSITINNYFIEGESSSEYYRNNYKDDNNLCIVNIGGKTTDIISINTYGAREKLVSLNIGVNSLMSDLVRFTKARNSSVLMSWLDNGYNFNKEYEKDILEVKKLFVESIWTDLHQVVSLTNPNKTTILLTGGGSILTKDEFKEVIPKSYKVKTLSNTENIFADLLGMVSLSNERISIPNEDNTQEEKEVKVKKKRKSKYDDFVKLKEQGMDKESIIENLGIANQTYNNMLCRYNRELKEIA